MMAMPRQESDSTWRRSWIAALLAVGQLTTPVLISQVYGEFLSTGATSDAAITPAGYAFSIWGLITLLCALTCVVLLRTGLGASWEARLLAEASLVFLGFTAWLLAAAQNWLWVTVAIFAAMVAVLVDVMRLLVRHSNDVTAPAWVRRLATVSFGLYLGWSSVAVFVNVAAALVNDGWSQAATGWQTAILGLAAAAAVGLTIFLHASPGYVGASLWALVAVAIGSAQRGVPTLPGLSCAAAVLLAAAAAVTVSTRRKRRD